MHCTLVPLTQVQNIINPLTHFDVTHPHFDLTHPQLHPDTSWCTLSLLHLHPGALTQAQYHLPFDVTLPHFDVTHPHNPNALHPCAGAIPSLVDLLDHGIFPETQVQAAGALEALAKATAVLRNYISGLANAIPFLTALLGGSCPSGVRKQATATLDALHFNWEAAGNVPIWGDGRGMGSSCDPVTGRRSPSTAHGASGMEGGSVQGPSTSGMQGASTWGMQLGTASGMLSNPPPAEISCHQKRYMIEMEIGKRTGCSILVHMSMAVVDGKVVDEVS